MTKSDYLNPDDIRHALALRDARRASVPPPPLAVRVLGMAGAVLGSAAVVGASVALLWAVTALGFCL